MYKVKHTDCIECGENRCCIQTTYFGAGFKRTHYICPSCVALIADCDTPPDMIIYPSGVEVRPYPSAVPA